VINKKIKKKGRFLNIYNQKMNLNKIKLRLREIRKLTQAEVEIADLWEIELWIKQKY
jgi:hypothetical protein